MKTKLPLYLALLTLTQCSKCDDTPAPLPPLQQLPAETQTGAGTAGCLVNGQPFIVTNPLRAFGDWIALNELGISTSRKRSGAADEGTSLRLHGSLATGQVFRLIQVGPSNTIPAYTPGANEFTVFHQYDCYYNGEYIIQGQIELLKFDPVARIAAGRFAYALVQPGCDTLKVTDGRFDIKF